MSKIHITFFPHSTTFDNEAGISTGQADTGLSPLGKIQMKNLEKLMSNVHFDKVFCSDLIRAKETAESVFGKRNQIEIDDRLKEIDIGILTGKKDDHTHPLAKQYIDTPFPEGESWKDVEKRMGQFLDDLKLRHNGGKIAIIGHQGTQLALEVLLNKLTWNEAIENDWRKTKCWQPGWEYIL